MSRHGAVGGAWGTSDASRERRAAEERGQLLERAMLEVEVARMHERRAPKLTARLARDAQLSANTAWAQAVEAMLSGLLGLPPRGTSRRYR